MVHQEDGKNLVILVVDVMLNLPQRGSKLLRLEVSVMLASFISLFPFIFLKPTSFRPYKLSPKGVA